jgi:hypothetical protein
MTFIVHMAKGFFGNTYNWYEGKVDVAKLRLPKLRYTENVSIL